MGAGHVVPRRTENGPGTDRNPQLPANPAPTCSRFPTDSPRRPARNHTFNSRAGTAVASLRDEFRPCAESRLGRPSESTGLPNAKPAFIAGKERPASNANLDKEPRIYNLRTVPYSCKNIRFVRLSSDNRNLFVKFVLNSTS